MARRIIEVRGRLSAKLDANGNIKLDLSALSKEDQRAIDVSKLIESIVLEFDPLPSIPSKEAIIDNRDVHDVAKVQERVESLLSAVRRTGRQEERIALLMSAILSDPAVGKSALLQYQGDRAKTADRAIRELRRLLTENDKSWPSDDRVVAALVPWLFTQQWPMTRGDLLFYLAKHLHKWPSANKAIRNSLARTRSMYVERRRMQILDLLDLLK
jgi:hypothetical protein